MKITAKEVFSAKFFALDEQDRQKILDFTAHVAQHGLKGLTGRNKSSAPNNPHTKKQKQQYAHAQNIVFGITKDLMKNCHCGFIHASAVCVA